VAGWVVWKCKTGEKLNRIFFLIFAFKKFRTFHEFFDKKSQKIHTFFRGSSPSAAAASFAVRFQRAQDQPELVHVLVHLQRQP
jgi:hypothetical protein